jgi:hypothetical protein
VRQQGVVEFSQFSDGPVDLRDFPSDKFTEGETEDKTFRVYLSLDDIHPRRFSTFAFIAYLYDETKNQPKVTRFEVTGTPTGDFRDVATKVTFHVTNAGTNATGRILVPVFGAARSDLLSYPNREDPLNISISPPQPIRLGLTNSPETLTILVTDVMASYGCLKCWDKMTTTVHENNPLNINPGSTVDLPLDLRPRSFQALLTSAFIVKPSVPHDTVTLTVTYHSTPGGADRSQIIPIKIRFSPTLWALAIAMCGGTFVGLIARYLLTGQFGGSNQSISKAIVAAFLFTLIAELLGLLLTSHGDSKLVLFDFDLDPRQTLPAFILAMFVSGGPAVKDWVKGFFPRSPSQVAGS